MEISAIGSHKGGTVNVNGTVLPRPFKEPIESLYYFKYHRSEALLLQISQTRGFPKGNSGKYW